LEESLLRKKKHFLDKRKRFIHSSKISVKLVWILGIFKSGSVPPFCSRPVRANLIAIQPGDGSTRKLLSRCSASNVNRIAQTDKKHESPHGSEEGERPHEKQQREVARGAPSHDGGDAGHKIRRGRSHGCSADAAQVKHFFIYFFSAAFGTPTRPNFFSFLRKEKKCFLPRNSRKETKSWKSCL
jgi:hypothetical protein